MGDIRFYDFEFNLIYIEHEILSAEWYIKYNGIGTFEAHIRADGGRAEAILNNRYIVAAQGDYQAIVTGKQISGSELILYGRTLNWLLSKRVIPNFSTYRLNIGTNAEDIARWVVSEAFGDVENFVLAEKAGLDYEKHFWRNVYNPASEVVKDCLDNAGAGHRLVFDRKNKSWRFEVYTGKENPLIISVGNKNAYDIRYNEDLQDYCSGGWYQSDASLPDSGTAGGDENSEDGGEDGPEWREIKAENPEQGIYYWETVLGGTSPSEASSSLERKRKINECQVKSSSLEYGKDYGLGDFVRAEFEYGDCKICKRCRITGVKLWFEAGDSGQIPVFDSL